MTPATRGRPRGVVPAVWAPALRDAVAELEGAERWVLRSRLELARLLAAAHREGASQRELALVLEVPRSTVQRLLELDVDKVAG